MAKERVGYPTQKPLALLKRIIVTSSNPGDLVLDPFCGCATACVAADKLDRRWVGIDLSAKAIELVAQRLQQPPPLGIGSLFHHGYVTARTDIPRRTDIEAPVHYRQDKHVLFGRQEGLCGGCRMDFPFKIFEVDHMVPQSRGGTDQMENLQLLCSGCNRIKGDRPQKYLMARLSGDGGVINLGDGLTIFHLWTVAAVVFGFQIAALAWRIPAEARRNWQQARDMLLMPHPVTAPNIVASEWTVVERRFSMAADIRKVLDSHGPGIYTLVLLGEISGAEEEIISEYSIFHEAE